MTIVLNHTRKRGDTTPFPDDGPFVYLDAAGEPVDITGWTIVLTVTSIPAPTDGTTVVYQLTARTSGLDVGEFEFAPSTLQAATAPGSYYYDLQITDGAGTVATPYEGSWIIEQDRTK